MNNLIFEYISGGWFRTRGVPRGVSTNVLHGEHIAQVAMAAMVFEQCSLTFVFTVYALVEGLPSLCTFMPQTVEVQASCFPDALAALDPGHRVAEHLRGLWKMKRSE